LQAVQKQFKGAEKTVNPFLWLLSLASVLQDVGAEVVLSAEFNLRADASEAATMPSTKPLGWSSRASVHVILSDSSPVPFPSLKGLSGI
jgi:hypothetical protein